MDRHADTAALLLSAWRDPTQLLNSLPGVLVPVDEAHAYAVQRRVSEGLGSIGGWKVGLGPDRRPSCSPLPATGIMAAPAQLPARSYTLRGVEGEIAFRFATDLPPREAPYQREEIIAAIACCVPVIEVLQSRFTHPDQLDRWTALADSLSHGALVYGAPAADWQGIDFSHETVRVLVDGAEVKAGTGNPAGDMIALMQWVADTGARWADGIKAGQYITCGSWTGKDYAPPGGNVQVEFAHAGAVALEFGQ